MNIPLHPRLGVNPKLWRCPICGNDAGILLLGARNYHETCEECGAVVVGGIDSMNPCARCGCKKSHTRTYLDENDRYVNVTHADPCSECAEQMKTKVACILVENESPTLPLKIGDFVVFIPDKDFSKALQGEEAERALKTRSCYIPPSVWRALGLPPPTEIQRKADKTKEQDGKDTV